MPAKNCWPAIAAALVALHCGVAAGGGPAIAPEPEASAGPSAPVRACSSYADCPTGMICAGAGGGATGSCLRPSQLPQTRPAYDALPQGYLGSIYGHPMIQGRPPMGAPASDKGGIWDAKDGTYHPSRGGKWTYQPGGADGFSGVWVYLP